MHRVQGVPCHPELHPLEGGRLRHPVGEGEDDGGDLRQRPHQLRDHGDGEDGRLHGRHLRGIPGQGLHQPHRFRGRLGRQRGHRVLDCPQFVGRTVGRARLDAARDQRLQRWEGCRLQPRDRGNLRVWGPHRLEEQFKTRHHEPSEGIVSSRAQGWHHHSLKEELGADKLNWHPVTAKGTAHLDRADGCGPG